MRILVACEFSGIVREAFIARGHTAFSCDLLPSEIPGPHLQCDVREVLKDHWDMMIGFPPCTYLAISGARWWQTQKWVDNQPLAYQFFLDLYNADIEKICLENPIGIISRWLRKPDQIVEPYMFGHRYTKATCLWLKNLPLLQSTDMVYPLSSYVHTNVRSQADRSRTFMGVAKAMAAQWS